MLRMQDKLQSWSEPFREAFAGHAGVHWFEVSLVESVVCASPCTFSILT